MLFGSNHGKKTSQQSSRSNFEQFETHRTGGIDLHDIRSDYDQSLTKKSSIIKLDSNVISDLLVPVKSAEQFFKKRNSNSEYAQLKKNFNSESAQLINEVKLKYNHLFNGSATIQPETLPPIQSLVAMKVGVSPEQMLQIIQENKLRRQRYHFRSQEVKLLEQQLEWEKKELKAQHDIKKYERAQKIRVEQMQQLERKRKARYQKDDQNQGHDYLAEEPLFLKLEKLDKVNQKKEAKQYEKQVFFLQKPPIDLKQLRYQAQDYTKQIVSRGQFRIEKNDWSPPPVSQFYQDVKLRDQKQKEEESAKVELQRLLIDKRKKFSVFIRKYLKPEQQKVPKPLYKKQEPRQKVKFSPSCPLVKINVVIPQAKSTPQKSQATLVTPQVKSTKSQAVTVTPNVKPAKSQRVSVYQKLKTPKSQPVNSLPKEAFSLSTSKTLSDVNKKQKPIEAGNWTAHITSQTLSPDQKYTCVHNAAKILEQKALRSEAKMKNSTIRSNRSNQSFSKETRLSTAPNFLPLPHTSNYYQQLNTKINSIEMTDALLVDAIKAKMALLALDLSN